MAVWSREKGQGQPGHAANEPRTERTDATTLTAQSATVWRGQLAGPDAVFQLVRGNLRHGWRLLLVVGLGLLVAVTLLCTVPLYSALVGYVQLQAALNANGPAGRNVEVVASSNIISDQPDGPPDALRQRENRAVAPLLRQYLGSFTSPDVNTYLAAGKLEIQLFDDAPAAPGGGTVLQAYFLAYDYAQAGQHMQLLAGRFPQSTPLAGDDVAEALITGQMAHDRQLHVGDTMSLEQGVVVRVVGVWEPTDPTDEYWNGRSFQVGLMSTANTDTYLYPVLLDQSGFTKTFFPLPTFGMEQHWIAYTQSQRINSGNMGAIANQVPQLRNALSQTVTFTAGDGYPLVVQVITQIDKVIPAVAAQLAVLAQPLYVMVAQVEGLALLFVMAMAGLLVDAQSGTIATLRSRGASGTQILGGYALQGGVLAAIAGAAGPFLAGVVAVALAGAFIPDITRGAAAVGPYALAAAVRPRDALAPAVAGAALGMSAVVVAVWRASRLDVLAFRREQGRATRQPFWRRYYLDMLLALVCVLGYLDLGAFGGLGVREQLGNGATSPLLFATPGLLLLAGALVTLRVFPLAAGLGARLAARARGVAGMLAFAQIARTPGGALLVALLLALGVGLGLFALTFGTTLAHNGVDRAAYLVGADARVSESGTQTGGDATRAQTELAGLPGALGVTPVFRGGSTTLDNTNSPVLLLGIDPASWAQVAGVTSWRADYASAPLGTLMSQLQAHQWPAGSFAPGGSAALGDGGHPIWAIVTRTLADAQHLQVGQRFALAVNNTTASQTTFVVGAITAYFPTLYPGQAPAGALVAGIGDLEALRASPPIGPNEFWAHTTGAPFLRAVDRVGPNISVINVLDRREVLASIGGSPLQSGMRGLLTAGAALAVALALLGSVVQSALNARRRAVQFAVLRTIGMGARQLRRLVLGEQVVVYVFGMVGGLALGVTLVSATLPYLQFNDASLDTTTLGVPPNQLVFDPATLGICVGTLALALLVGLFFTTRAAARVGLGSTLRLGED